MIKDTIVRSTIPAIKKACSLVPGNGQVNQQANILEPTGLERIGRFVHIQIQWQASCNHSHLQTYVYVYVVVDRFIKVLMTMVRNDIALST